MICPPTSGIFFHNSNIESVRLKLWLFYSFFWKCFLHEHSTEKMLSASKARRSHERSRGVFQLGYWSWIPPTYLLGHLPPMLRKTSNHKKGHWLMMFWGTFHFESCLAMKSGIFWLITSLLERRQRELFFNRDYNLYFKSQQLRACEWLSIHKWGLPSAEWGPKIYERWFF